jgi:hypothetical protein
MAFYILTASGKVIVRKSIWALSMEEMQSPEVQAITAGLDLTISNKIGDTISDAIINPELKSNFPAPPDEIFDDDESLDEPEDPAGTRVEVDNFTPKAYDEYLLAKILLPHEGEFQTGRVQARVTGQDGMPVWRQNSNPLLDTREYKVEFPDGSIDALQPNIIAENMYSQINSEGLSLFAILTVKEIVYHRKNRHALLKDEDGFFLGKEGQKYPKKTTRDWNVLVKWKDRTSSWLPVKDLKDSNPVELAEYAKANKPYGRAGFCMVGTEGSAPTRQNYQQSRLTILEENSNFRSKTKKLLRLMRRQAPTFGAWQLRKRDEECDARIRIQ